MAAAAGIEATLNAVVAKLQAGMATKLAAIQAECADGVVLDTPAGYSLSTRAEIPGWPWLMVLPDQTEPDLDPGQYLTRRHTIAVVSWCMDYDEATLALKLLRTQRAACEVLIAGRRPGAVGDPSGYSLNWRRDDYGQVFRDDGPDTGFFYQAVRSRFEVKQDQTV